MKNPFEYGGVVGGDSFCNRKDDLAYLKRVFENAERVFIYSERRFGKTSLVKKALSSLSTDDYVYLYVDLWPTVSESDFALRLANAITNSMSTTTESMLKTAKSLFAHFKPAVTSDDAGRPQIVFGVTKEEVTAPALEEVLNKIPEAARKSGKRIIVILDEVQQILEYGSDLAERTLRSTTQHHSDISYVFLGSRKHMLQKMFLDKQRPLYRSAGHYPLKTISTLHWIPFITDKFLSSGKEIEEDVIQKLCEFTQGHPFYTQHLCHALWELTEVKTSVDPNSLSKAIDLLLERENFAFTILWESLTANQKILISAIAVSPVDFKPFSGDFLQKSGLRTASNVQRAVDALLNKDLLDRDEVGSLNIPDRFLKLWIQRRLILGTQYADVSYIF